MNFKGLQKELPVLLGWKIHSPIKVSYETFCKDLRSEEFFLADISPEDYDYDFHYGYHLLIWGKNQDLVIKKMKEVLDDEVDNGLLVDSVTPLCQEEISKCIECLQAVYSEV